MIHFMFFSVLFFFIRASCTDLACINLPAGSVVGLLQFQSFCCPGDPGRVIQDQKTRKDGRVNLCLCVLCRERKFD